jgi:WD40 repeat protein
MLLNILFNFKLFIIVWDCRQSNTNPIFSLKEMDDFVTSMITNDDKKYLVCASGDGTITTINMRTKKLHVQVRKYIKFFINIIDNIINFIHFII